MLDHVLLCSRRWQRLRQFAVSLDPQRVLLRREPCGDYRLWSGIIGQYNLLHECTHHHDTSSLLSRLVKKVVPTDIRMEYRYSRSLEVVHLSELEKLLSDHIVGT
jgi:hypothetical protein